MLQGLGRSFPGLGRCSQGRAGAPRVEQVLQGLCRCSQGWVGTAGTGQVLPVLPVWAVSGDLILHSHGCPPQDGQLHKALASLSKHSPGR